jgi:Zn-dependent M28 family amino/carboxypeptidase
MKRICLAPAIVLILMCGLMQAEQRGGLPFPIIDASLLLRHIEVLSSDQYGGRLPGTRGEELSVTYIADQFRKVGLKPGNKDGTFFQQVPLVGITPDASMQLTLRKGNVTEPLKYLDDFVAWTRREVTSTGIEGSQIVFAGYGVEAPEFGWDDFKGADVKGKTLVMLVNDPPVPDPKDPKKLDPRVFGGEAMTYYGRWTYKYDIGAQKGAAGVILVHENGPAGYPWSVVRGFAGERFELVSPDKNRTKASVEGWITIDTARRLFAMAGKDFDVLKREALSRNFRPVSLDTTASISLNNKLRRVNSRNVLGRLEGSDPVLKEECLVYTAHWDHLGTGPEGIYHGAVDNASGVAGLIEIARAFTRLAQAPKRSLLFAAVTAEEQGLLGSEYYVAHPVYPLAKTLADINMDSLNVHGKTRDITIIGLGKSDLDDYARKVATLQGRSLRADAEPGKGFYYRSDHFEFAKEGVPALDPQGGIEFEGKPPDYGQKLRAAFTQRDYHKPSDVVRPDWDLSGAVQDLQFLWMVGYDVAQAPGFPQWKPGAEFRRSHP